MLAGAEHKEISTFITEYNKEGAKILSRYNSSNMSVTNEGAYAVIDHVDDEHTRKVSAALETIISSLSARTEYVELVSALNKLNKVQEYRL